jgi:hypothetical protein
MLAIKNPIIRGIFDMRTVFSPKKDVQGDTGCKFFHTLE